MSAVADSTPKDTLEAPQEAQQQSQQNGAEGPLESDQVPHNVSHTAVPMCLSPTGAFAYAWSADLFVVDSKSGQQIFHHRSTSPVTCVAFLPHYEAEASEGGGQPEGWLAQPEGRLAQPEGRLGQSEGVWAVVCEGRTLSFLSSSGTVVEELKMQRRVSALLSGSFNSSTSSNSEQHADSRRGSDQVLCFADKFGDVLIWTLEQLRSHSQQTARLQELHEKRTVKQSKPRRLKSEATQASDVPAAESAPTSETAATEQAVQAADCAAVEEEEEEEALEERRLFEQEILLGSFLGHLAMVTVMRLIRDVGGQQLLLTADRDEKIRLSRFPNVEVCETLFCGHTEFVVDCVPVYLPIPHTLTFDTGTHKLGSEPHTGDEKTSLSEAEGRVLMLASVAADRTLRLWEAKSGTELACVALPVDKFPVNVLSLTPTPLQGEVETPSITGTPSITLAVLFADTSIVKLYNFNVTMEPKEGGDPTALAGDTLEIDLGGLTPQGAVLINGFSPSTASVLVIDQRAGLHSFQPQSKVRDDRRPRQVFTPEQAVRARVVSGSADAFWKRRKETAQKQKRARVESTK